MSGLNKLKTRNRKLKKTQRLNSTKGPGSEMKIKLKKKTLRFRVTKGAQVRENINFLK
jgi:hypothetical protein